MSERCVLCGDTEWEKMDYPIGWACIPGGGCWPVEAEDWDR